MSDKKIFDDFAIVDCNNCAHYWDDSCEGSHKAQKRLCTSFLATRKVVIPQQIKSLQNAIFWLRAWVVILSITMCGILGALTYLVWRMV